MCMISSGNRQSQVPSEEVTAHARGLASPENVS